MPGDRLTRQERRHIASGLAGGLGYAEIARRLGRPTSTVSREVSRNGGRGGYRADEAHQATGGRARRHRPAAPPEPSAAVGAYGRAPEAVRGFLEQFATLMTETGVPRMPARVLTCLFAADTGSLTAGELVRHLRVSPASVSKAIGYLEGLGLVRRERDLRVRRERYHVDDDVWIRAWTASAQKNTLWSDAARRGVEILGAGTPAGARLAVMGRFFAQLGDDMAGTPSASVVDDALTVLAALVHAGAPPAAPRLAAALGWPLDRVTTALDATADRLTPAQRKALGRPDR
ncbi:GbsR/MarR family transcriptional regulator [Actinomadura xylanilytica]|uniref:GbsR/MarR family transcriptional regulator n=1 Tax=Actinomadura xylanilytica TaxID=887459 RepID=UPI00255A7A0D|nr:helix-turn-helix domain-containing protein [Actinomadura xylanilytica]MDL4773083.1 helix-turn-helix domain-containing protein [Actinomadura xylanilytica]